MTKSANMPPRMRTALRLLGLFAMFLLVGTTVGLKEAALSFAFLGPVVLMRGPERWLLALLTLSTVFLLAYVIPDTILYAFYPEQFVTEWLRKHVF
jgi:hypothetical protein